VTEQIRHTYARRSARAQTRGCAAESATQNKQERSSYLQRAEAAAAKSLHVQLLGAGLAPASHRAAASASSAVFNNARLITIRCTSEDPSPISLKRASRQKRSTGMSLVYPYPP
jgi:hypothetical protein